MYNYIIHTYIYTYIRKSDVVSWGFSPEEYSPNQRCNRLITLSVYDTIRLWQETSVPSADHPNHAETDDVLNSSW